jgi:4-amino-4-deoxy-L-arabinose transferase-like glycosyltransferase
LPARWEHTPGTALAVFALVAVVKALDSRRRSWWLVAAGAAIGLGLTMRAELYVYPIAIVVGLLSIHSARSLPLMRSIVWLVIGGLLTAGPWWLYQFIAWGSPFGPRLQQNMPVLGGTDMLERLGDTTGRNWSMLWPAAGDVVVLALLLVVLTMALLAWVLRRRIAWIADVAF